MKRLLGCLAIIILLFLLSIGGIYYLFMHTAFPGRQVAKKLASDAQKRGIPLEIGEVTGSLAEGYKIGRIGFDNGTTKFSLKGMGLDYSGVKDLLGRRVIIYEAYVDSLALETDFSQLGSSKGTTQMGTQQQTGATRTGTGGGVRQCPADLLAKVFKIFRIDEIRLSDISLIDTQSDFRFDAKELSVGKILVEGDTRQMGEIIVDTNMLVFKTEKLTREPPETVWYERNFLFSLQPAISDQIAKEMEFRGYFSLHAEFDGELRVGGLDGAFRLAAKDDEAEITLTDLSLRDYLPQVAAPDLVTLEAKIKTESKPSSLVLAPDAWFVIGDKRFLGEVAAMSDPRDWTLSGRHADGTEATLSVFAQPFGLPVRVTCPNEAREDACIAESFLGQRYDESSVSQRADIAAWKQRYMVMEQPAGAGEESNAGEPDGEL